MIGPIIFGSIYDPPMGIANDELEVMYQNYYRPIIKILYKYKNVKLILFYSGRLLQWIKANHGEFFSVLYELLQRKQVELLGSAFYSPILSLISRQDSIGQIELLTTYLRKNFGRRPRGCWITEQLWEPTLPSILKIAGMEYTFLSDYHYWKAGFAVADYYSPCITEDQGKFLNVFPFLQSFLQYFWHMDMKEIVSIVESTMINTEYQVLGLLHSDPKIGSGLRKTIEHFESIIAFFSEQVSEKNLELVLPSKYLQENRQYPRAYFPVSSINEMYWFSDSMLSNINNSGLSKNIPQDLYPSAAQADNPHYSFYFGNIFRHNISHYTEINQMYSKMQYIHTLTHQIRGDIQRKRSAIEELWKGQSNAAFWHGDRGGIYINGYRKSIYASLIAAEKITREQGIFAPSILKVDFDMDGLDEILYQGNMINAYLHCLGGMLFEIDYLPANWNYLDTMGRYHELYHEKDQERRGYDTYPRKGFIDHFLSPQTNLEQFNKILEKKIFPLANQLYTLEKNKGTSSKKQEVTLSIFCDVNKGKKNLHMSKKYSFSRKSITVDYCLQNCSNRTINTAFVVEMNLSFLEFEESCLGISTLVPEESKVDINMLPAVFEKLEKLRFEDYANKVDLEVIFSTQCECWILSLETEHLDRNIWQRVYQGTTVLSRWNIELKPLGQFNSSIQLQFSNRTTRKT